MTPEQRVLAAIRSWPNHPWLVLPGPTDISGSLAAHLVKELGLGLRISDEVLEDRPNIVQKLQGG